MSHCNIVKITITQSFDVEYLYDLVRYLDYYRDPSF